MDEKKASSSSRRKTSFDVLCTLQGLYPWVAFQRQHGIQCVQKLQSHRAVFEQFFEEQLLQIRNGHCDKSAYRETR